MARACCFIGLHRGSASTGVPVQRCLGRNLICSLPSAGGQVAIGSRSEGTRADATIVASSARDRPGLLRQPVGSVDRPASTPWLLRAARRRRDLRVLGRSVLLRARAGAPPWRGGALEAEVSPRDGWRMVLAPTWRRPDAIHRPSARVRWRADRLSLCRARALHPRPAGVLRRGVPEPAVHAAGAGFPSGRLVGPRAVPRRHAGAVEVRRETVVKHRRSGDRARL